MRLSVIPFGTLPPTCFCHALSSVAAEGVQIAFTAVGLGVAVPTGVAVGPVFVVAGAVVVVAVAGTPAVLVFAPSVVLTAALVVAAGGVVAVVSSSHAVTPRVRPAARARTAMVRVGMVVTPS